MGFRFDQLPQNLREQVLRQEAAERPPVVVDHDRKPTPAERRAEVKELHYPFINWLGLHDLPYINPRSDQASSIREGWPDFTVMWQGKVACVEFKWPGQKLRKAQQECREWLDRTGNPCITAYSFDEARDFCRKALGID